MSPKKIYQDIDVLQAARERIKKLYESYDTVVVSFSGGKDSLVCLHLCKEQAQARGEKVHAIFRDQEYLPDELIDYVKGYHAEPWLDLKWLCIEQRGMKYVLGENRPYYEWKTGGPWLRQPPDFAIMRPMDSAGFISRRERNRFAEQFYPGKIACVLGLRAAESINRFQALTQRSHENWIDEVDNLRTSVVKPIYDWEENDILKYLYENQIPLCKTYIRQWLAGASLRISTPFNPEAAKKGLKTLRATDAKFYEKAIEHHPDMKQQEFYYKQLDRCQTLPRDGTLEQLMEVVNKCFPDPSNNRAALSRAFQFYKRHKKNPEFYPMTCLFDWASRGVLNAALLGGKHGSHRSNKMASGEQPKA